MAEVLNLFGASWSSYVLEPHPVGTVFKPICAVYALCRRRPRRWEVFCVGETHSLSESFNFDERDAFELSMLEDATHIGILETKHEEDRGLIVRDLRSRLRQSFNERAAKPEDLSQLNTAADWQRWQKGQGHRQWVIKGRGEKEFLSGARALATSAQPNRRD